ncbi:MAG: PD40 domain-containing protein [Chloroflexi bacterium]|nr:PD40 domain-containing protein [Chloroflexota bacterium]
MISKIKMLICGLAFLVACQTNLDPTHVISNPTVPHVTLATTTSTAINASTPVATAIAIETVAPPTATPTPLKTITPVASLPELLITPSPVPTATPEFVWPEASLLFVRDNNLQQWLPETNEVKILAANVHASFVSYSGEVVVFMRELMPTEEFVLVVFHIPTGLEIELLNASELIPALYDTTIFISPNGRWLAYVTGDSRDSAVLTVREIMIEDQQLILSEPVLVITPGNGWNWPYDRIMWPTENEISWSDESGIWVADVGANIIEPVVAILPSTNTFLFGSPNPAYWDKGPSLVFSKFIPLCMVSRRPLFISAGIFFEYGELRVIERGTNRLAELPESGIGEVSDGALWLDETTLVHYQVSGTIRVWQIIPRNSDSLITLQKTVPAVPLGYVERLWAFDNHIQVSDYSSLFDIDLETGEQIELANNIKLPLHWSPDGQYLLWDETTFIDEERVAQVFLYDLQSNPIPLDDVLGLNSCCWSWYDK